MNILFADGLIRMVRIRLNYFAILVTMGTLLPFAGLEIASAQCLPDSDNFSMQDVLPAAEYNALVALYTATAGASWTDPAGWVNGYWKAWAGVTIEGVAFNDVGSGSACYEVSQLGHVARIELPGNALTGALPASMGDLEFLQVLDLSGNALTGSIPASLGNLILLQYIYLQNNQLTGAIPAGLVDGSALQVLNVSGNPLASSLPDMPRDLPFLKSLDVSNSDIEGTLPASIDNLPFASSLNVSGNLLEGEIPASLGALSLLEDLDLSSNALCGDMPNSLSNLTTLASADLSNNQLTVNQAVVDAWTAQGTVVNIDPQGLVLLHPETGVHDFQAQSGSFDVFTCANWTVVKSEGWISITSAETGTGNSTVTYEVTLNDTGSPRSGSITVEGASFTVNQGTPDCTYAIAPGARAHTASGGSDSVTVTAGSGCPWEAESNAGWISISSGQNDTGNGTVGYTVAENTSCSAREGTLTIAGETFTINQDAGVLVATLNPVEASYTNAGGSGSFSITASGQDCDWGAISNAGWITVTAGHPGTGDGLVSYTVSANTGGPRVGTIAAAGVSFTINQGAPNNDPIITDADPVNVVMSEDGTPVAFSLTLHATDIDGDSLTWSILSPANNGSAAASGTGLSKAISYVPAGGFTGLDTFDVQVTDSMGGSDSITVQVSVRAEIQFDLVRGYNLISIPFTDTGLAKANDVLAVIPQADTIWYWDGNNQAWSGQTLPGFNNFDIVPGQAYLVAVTSDAPGTFDLDGYWADPSFTWSGNQYRLITLPKSKDDLTTADDLLTDLPPGVSKTVWYWDTANGQWSGQVLGGFNNFAVEPGRPYLIQVEVGGTWPE